jgi:ATP-dependent DNA helicase RecG
VSDTGKPPITLAELAAMPVDTLHGVGPKRSSALAQVDVTSVLDLLTHYPRRYLDRTREARLADLEPGQEATVIVTVERVDMRRTRNRRTIVEVDVTDDSGGLRCVFFNQPWLKDRLAQGQEMVLFGKVEEYRGRPQMTSPVLDFAGDKTGRVVPLYPQSEKARLNSSDIGSWIDEILRRSRLRGFTDPVPEPVLERHDLIGRDRALRLIHRPETIGEMTIARKRLVFDELLRVQLALVLRKRSLEQITTGIGHAAGDSLVERFHDRLPYPLTGAQDRVIAEILGDLRKTRPMHRLLQGDVGSGKTVVAVSALLLAVEGGHQGALMAPTEVLAEQHRLGVSELLDGFTVPEPESLLGERPLKVELLTNRRTAAERRDLLAGLAAGTVDLVIGTHALIQEGVDFRSLGVVVIDEQHRFGVEQRAALRDAGAAEAVPDVLVMTATPIPRTAAMTVYGDLDVSVLDELPPGRTPVLTEWVRSQPGELDLEESGLWGKVRAEVEAGRQAYVVCPLIEESDKLEVRSAEETYEQLLAGPLEGLSLGLLHGRVPAGEKERVMGLFRSAEIQVLVATTVIEVGVDVPNATVMVILDADRFGIAQLHQLRGRVGRGADQSFCYLVGEGATDDGRARLEALVETTDGFELAEVDLDLRGEGTIMGERQKGRNDLRLASLRRDREWVAAAREEAFTLVDADPALAAHETLRAEVELFLGDDAAEFLMKS